MEKQIDKVLKVIRMIIVLIAFISFILWIWDINLVSIKGFNGKILASAIITYILIQLAWIQDKSDTIEENKEAFQENDVIELRDTLNEISKEV